MSATGGLGRRADERRRAGDLRGALSDLDRALELEPGAPWLLGSRAELRRRLGDLAGCVADAEALIAAAPEDPAGCVARAEGLRGMGDYAGAIAAADRAVALAPRRAWPLIVRAKARRELGQNALASADCERAARLEPGFAKAHAWRGEALRALGRNRAARAALDEALRLDAQLAWALALRGQVRAEAGDFDGAERDLDAAFSMDRTCSGAYDFLGAGQGGLAASPLCAWILAWRGLARIAAGASAKGLADLDRAVALDGRRAWLLCRRGEALLQAGRPGPALSDLERAARLHPRGARIRFWRAEARRLSGDPRRAARELTALLGDPAAGSFAALASLSRALARGATGERGAMIEDFRRALASCPPELKARAEAMIAQAGLSLEAPDPAALASEGWALLERRRYDEGIAAVSRAAALEPGRAWEHAGWPRDARDGGARSLRLRALAGLKARSGPVVHYFRARILRGLGREDEALSELEKARPLFKSCTWALECAAGELLVEIGRLGAARASFERAAALNPRHARARAWRGEVLYWLGRAQAAAREFDAAVRAEPEAAWAHAWRGQFLLWTGRYGEARRALDRALALDPRNAWARAWRGAAEALAGDPKEGLRDIETAIRLDPGDVEARIWRGELLARAGRTAEALRELSVARRRGPDRPWLYAVSAWARGLRGDERGMNRELAEARRLAPEVFAAAADVAGLERIFAAAKGNRTYRRLG